MRIQQTEVAMNAHSYSKESLQYTNETAHISIEPNKPDRQEAFQQMEEAAQSAFAPEKTEKSESHKLYQISEEDYQKVRMLEKLLSYITGKKVRFILPERVEASEDSEEAHSRGSGLKKGWGARNRGPVSMTYSRQQMHYQREQSVSFAAEGKVTTEDGRAIEFNFEMERSESVAFYSERTSLTAGRVIDPLVINYGGNATELTKEKYSFDLDYDGTSDQISFLEKGSGFLAFDRNKDGEINDGRELFGPESGDGFADLGKYDADGNGWIDEADDIFDKLRIWEKDEDGNDVLFALGEKGIGAIYLGHVATDYALGGGPFSDDGFIRQSGIFLKETGEAGAVHHIDLAL